MNKGNYCASVSGSFLICKMKYKYFFLSSVVRGCVRRTYVKVLCTSEGAGAHSGGSKSNSLCSVLIHSRNGV